MQKRVFLKMTGFVLATLTAAVGGLFLAPAAQAQTPGVTDSEIVIGAFGPLTGPAAWIGLSARDGMTLATNEINAHGGVNGRKIKLIFEGATTPADSIAAAKKLVEQDKVFAIVIGAGSTGAAAAADYLREVGIPTYNIVGATPKIREPFGKNIFSGVYPHVALLGGFFASEINHTSPPPKTASILAGTYELPQAELAALTPRLDKLGIKVTTIERFDAGTKDFTAQLLAAAKSKPDVLVFLGNATEAGLALKQAPELGVTGTPWVLSVAAISRSVPQVAGQGAEGARSIWMFPYFHDEKAKPMADFDRKWREAYGNPPPGRPSYVDIDGYGDMYVLAIALRETGKTLSWDGLIAKWETMKNVTPSQFGPFADDVIFPESFTDKDRDGNKAYSTVRIKNGAWQVDR